MSDTQDEPADTSPTGAVLVFSYSGFMLVEHLDQFVQKPLEINGVTVTIFPPLRLAPPTWRPIPQANEANFRRLFPTAPFVPPFLRLAVLPSLNEAGQPALTQIWGDKDENDLPADTLMVVVSGGEPEARTSAAETAISRLFEWLRAETMQWWIGRPTEALTGNLHLEGALYGAHSREPPSMTGKGNAPYDGTKRISPGLWSEIFARMIKNISPSAEDVVFTEIAYYYFAGEIRTAILLSTGLFEIQRDKILAKYSLKKHDLKASGVDLLRHVSKSFGDALGRDLSQENPKAFEFLTSCWIARGHLAHGKQTTWIFEGQTISLDALPQGYFVESIRTISAWLESV